jgi:hypothetical protein
MTVLLCVLLAAMSSEIIDRIAVSVEDSVITESELRKEIRVMAFLDETEPDLSGANKRKAAERLIDQYLMRHPEYLFGASHEHGVIDPDNPHILGGQLACACFEKPLPPDDERYFGPLTTKVAQIFAVG